MSSRSISSVLVGQSPTLCCLASSSGRRMCIMHFWIEIDVFRVSSGRSNTPTLALRLYFNAH